MPGYTAGATPNGVGLLVGGTASSLAFDESGTGPSTRAGQATRPIRWPRPAAVFRIMEEDDLEGHMPPIIGFPLLAGGDAGICTRGRKAD